MPWHSICEEPIKATWGPCPGSSHGFPPEIVIPNCRPELEESKYLDSYRMIRPTMSNGKEKNPSEHGSSRGLFAQLHSFFNQFKGFRGPHLDALQYACVIRSLTGPFPKGSKTACWMSTSLSSRSKEATSIRVNNKASDRNMPTETSSVKTESISNTIASPDL